MRPGFLLSLVLALLAPTAAAAQIAGPPYIFTNGTVINATEVNANFAAIYAAALNRTGGTMTGPLLFSADNAHDIGALGTTRPRDLNLGRNALVGGTLTVAGASTFTGAVTISTGNIAEAAITNGTILARVAGTETITAPWTFASAGNAITINSAGPTVIWSETGVTANNGMWRMYADVEDFYFQTLLDTGLGEVNIWKASRTGTTVDSFTIAAAQTLLAAGTLAAPGLSFAADPNTGLFNFGADSLQVVLGGAAYMTFTPSLISVSTAVDMNVSPFTLGELSLGSMPASNDGAMFFCNNCNIANPCTAGGTGAIAKRLNAVWVCN